jgi:Bacterial Ig-like domain (group 3)
MSEHAGTGPRQTSPATTTILTVKPQPALAGQRTHLVVAVTSPAGLTPAGAVSLKDGALTLGTARLNEGHATLAVRLFSSGRHTLRAMYDGDERSAASDAVCELTVLEPVSVALSANFAAGPGEWLTVIARVHGRWDGPPCMGDVLFECDGVPLGNEELEDGQAAIRRVLSPGRHALTATYAGDERHAGARSESLEVDA